MSDRIEKEDLRFMGIALELSRKGRGWTEPNPMVGAVAVKGGKILGAGYHRRYGDPHAEAVALQNIRSRGCTLYVTLEPCIHYGKTPPCANLILEKGVRQLAVGSLDPNPRVYRKGIKRLEKEGIEVRSGLMAEEIRNLNRHYFTFFTKKRPHVALKAGVSVDGKMTDKYLRSQWITDSRLRAISHGLRGDFAAVMVGRNTVIRDNPQLNIRKGTWRTKKLFRIVLDPPNNLEPDLRIFQPPLRNDLVVFSSQSCAEKQKKCHRHFFVGEKGGYLNLSEILDILYEMKIMSILVEGGGALLASFLRANLADEMLLFCSGTLLGGKESVELFACGTGLSRPVRFLKRRVYDLGSGYLVRGEL